MSTCPGELDQQQFIDNLNSTISPDLARALDYVKQTRKPLREEPDFIITTASEWCYNA